MAKSSDFSGMQSLNPAPDPAAQEQQPLSPQQLRHARKPSAKQALAKVRKAANGLPLPLLASSPQQGQHGPLKSQRTVKISAFRESHTLGSDAVNAETWTRPESRDGADVQLQPGRAGSMPVSEAQSLKNSLSISAGHLPKLQLPASGGQSLVHKASCNSAVDEGSAARVSNAAISARSSPSNQPITTVTSSESNTSSQSAPLPSFRLRASNTNGQHPALTINTSQSVGGMVLAPIVSPVGGSYDSRPVAAEDALLAVAHKMGVVRPQTHADNLTTGTKQPRARNVNTAGVGQVSPLGISFKMFDSLLESFRSKPELTTAQVAQQVITQQTYELRCRYCDLLAEKHLDTPTLYVVHCWQSSFVETMDAVKQYVLQQRTSTEDVYIWLDILCINLHYERTGADVGSVKDIIQSSDRVLVVVDRFGGVFSRTWCLWEIWQTMQSERFDKLVVLMISYAWDDLTHAFQTLNISRTAASRDRERSLLVSEMQRSVDLSQLAVNLREAMLTGAKRDLSRAEKLANVNPKRFGVSAATYAFLLSMHYRYSEAEEVMRQVMRLYDKASAKEVSERDLAATTYQLACILRDQGRLPDAERVLQEFVNQFRGMHDEVYMDGVAALSDILSSRRCYTKAEMLARKMLEEKQKVFGAGHHQVVKSMIQLANIAIAQKLYEEAEQHLREALTYISQGHQQENADSAMAYHLLSICSFNSNHTVEAKMLVDKALELRTTLLGTDHPSTLDTRAFQAEMLVREKRLKEAEVLLSAILANRAKSYGNEHHSTLTSMGQLADLLRDIRRDDEADEIEKRIISVGRQLLRYTKIDRFKSVGYVINYLAKRDHLLDKAAMFLAKAYIVFRERLGTEHELTSMTKSQLLEIIDKVKWIGNNSLEQAQIFNSSTQFGVAEVMYKQAYSISKLISPETDHKPLAQGLADALFGQGKVQEAKTIMRAAGITRKGMKQNMPASYLRWLNTRVAKYMDKAGEEDDDEDGA